MTFERRLLLRIRTLQWMTEGNQEHLREIETLRNIYDMRMADRMARKLNK